jgi:hypothetical protein
MDRFRQEALAMLAGFRESAYRQSLGQLVDFTIERDS